MIYKCSMSMFIKGNALNGISLGCMAGNRTPVNGSNISIVYVVINHRYVACFKLTCHHLHFGVNMINNDWHVVSKASVVLVAMYE